MKKIKELQQELFLAKADEAYHRKLMEYHQERILQLEEVIKLGICESHNSIFSQIHKIKPSPKQDDRFVVTKCQQCGAPVTVLKNHPYNGILCDKCSKIKSYTSIK